jgi:hypothetical protein
MARPVIAVSGSANAERQYRMPLRNLHQAEQVCREIGQQLADAGWDLLVFSEDTGFVEPWVVEGYRSSPAAEKGVIHVRQPRDHPATWTTEPGGPTIRREPFPAAVGWELPFFGAVLEADALLAIGGARATRTAGIIALSRRIPVLPVIQFGGAAEQIWDELTNAENDTDREIRSTMAENFGSGTAERLVAALGEQRKRQLQRLKAERRATQAPERRMARQHLVGLALVAIAVAAGAAYYGWELAGVVGIAMVAAAGGALVSRQAPRRTGRQGNKESEESSIVVSATRGAFAGLVTVLTYVVSQTLGSGPRDELANASITVFALVAGAVAGFTADRVLARIHPVEVGSLNRMAAGPLEPAPPGAQG